MATIVGSSSATARGRAAREHTRARPSAGNARARMEDILRKRVILFGAGLQNSNVATLESKSRFSLTYCGNGSAALAWDTSQETCYVGPPIRGKHPGQDRGPAPPGRPDGRTVGDLARPR